MLLVHLWGNENSSDSNLFPCEVSEAASPFFSSLELEHFPCGGVLCLWINQKIQNKCDCFHVKVFFYCTCWSCSSWTENIHYVCVAYVCVCVCAWLWAKLSHIIWRSPLSFGKGCWYCSTKHMNLEDINSFSKMQCGGGSYPQQTEQSETVYLLFMRL